MRLAKTMIMFVLAFGATAAHAEPNAAQQARDQDLTEQPPSVSAEARSLWDEAIAAERKRDFETAAAKYKLLHELLPSYSPIVRRLCLIEGERGHTEQAINLCREAVNLEPSAKNLSALAFALAQPAATEQGSAHQLEEAAQLADRAARLAPEDPNPHMVMCAVAMQRKDLADLTRCADRLQQLAPDDPRTWYAAAIARASHGEFGKAEEALSRARALGLPAAEADRLRAAFENAKPWYVGWGPLLLDAFGIWVGAAAAIFVVGWLLSAVVMRSAYRLPAEQSGRATGFEALIRRTYRCVLWVCCAYYYLSMPLLLLLVLGTGGAAIYAFFAIGEVPVKLVVLIAVGVLVTMWATLKSLFVRSVDSDPGTQIDLAQQPRLRAVLDEVAERIGTRGVDSVYVTPGVDLAVTERRSSLLKQMMQVPTERCLILGAGVLDGMRILDFKSILGHEYGHFQNRDTAGGGFALAVRRSLFTMARHLAQGGVAAWYNPAWLFVTGFYKLFFRISHGASRLQEILCDRWSAFAYGSEAFERGMRHVIHRSAAFGAHADATLKEVVEQQRPLANLYAYAPARGSDSVEIARKVDETINAKASPYDSHPPPGERIALVHKLNAPGRYKPADESPAWELFSNRGEIERSMTDLIRARVSASHGVTIRGAEDEASAESVRADGAAGGASNTVTAPGKSTESTIEGTRG